MGEKHRAEPPDNIDNRLRELRTAKGLSQSALADAAGITRQAVYAIEANQYLPTTAVALRLASSLGCRVEDLFNLVSAGQLIEGDVAGALSLRPRTRVKVARIGSRLVVRPVSQLGDVLNFTVSADGLVASSTSSGRHGGRARVELLRERRLIDEQIVVAGCDPSIFLAGEHLRRRLDKAGVVGIPMGSAAALDAVKRGEVHAAGLHVLDQRSGEWNLPYLRRHLGGKDATVVTFAAWEEGLMIQRGNPKRIRGVADLGRKDVAIVNREDGAGARFLLDRALKSAGLEPSKVRGYDRIFPSHLDVARLIAQGQVDAGMGVRSAANICGLDFIPLQEERYDLVIPSPYFKSHPGVAVFLDILTSRPLRAEIEALGGYDTRETGKVRELAPPRTA